MAEEEDPLRRMVDSLTAGLNRIGAESLAEALGPINRAATQILEQNNEAIEHWASSAFVSSEATSAPYLEEARQTLINNALGSSPGHDALRDFGAKLESSLAEQSRAAAVIQELGDSIMPTPAERARATEMVEMLQAVLVTQLEEARAEATEPSEVATIEAATELVERIDWGSLASPAQVRRVFRQLAALLAVMGAVAAAATGQPLVSLALVIAYLQSAADLFDDE